MARFVSRDGEYRVSEIILDGQRLYRIECRSVENALLIHDHQNGRVGLVGTAYGFKVADVTSPSQVDAIVPLDELQEVSA